MLDQNLFKTPVSLNWFQLNDFDNIIEYNFILNDDIWLNNLLLLKKGTLLSSTIIDKLIKFGIKKAQIEPSKRILNNPAFHSFEGVELLKNQYVLVIQDDFPKITKLVKSLLDTGFSDDNIFVSTEPESLEKYLSNRKLNYVFINSKNFDQKIQQVLKKVSSKRLLNIFVTESNIKNISSSSKLSLSNLLNINHLEYFPNSTSVRSLIIKSPSTTFNKLLNKGKGFYDKAMLWI